MRAHVDIDEEDMSTRMALATIYAQHGHPDDELLMLEQVRDIAPLPNMKWKRSSAVALHERLGDLYMARKRYDDAELAWSCAVGCARMQLVAKDGKAEDLKPLEPPAVADLLAHQGESLHLLGRVDEAKARAEEALRLDPENEAAKKLTESLVH
jgi:tetratricopeptide (TPR) repeat protein